MSFNELPRGIPGQSKKGVAPNARWILPSELSKQEHLTFSPKKVYLGMAHESKISIGGDRHLLTIAGTRSGKGTDAIIPNLLNYEGSVLVLDPKGENAKITAERRGLGRNISAGGMNQNVYVIDPFGVAVVPDEYRAGYDPIAYLEPHNPNFVDDCDSIADALVVASPDKRNDFWNSTARDVLRGFIAWIADAPNLDDRSLNELNRMVYLQSAKNTPEAAEGIISFDTLESLLADMVAGEHVGEGLPSKVANSLLSMESRELSNVMSTVRQHISFLSSPQMAKMFGNSERMPDLENWKNGKNTIYLCLPAGRLHRHQRFFRVFINQLLIAVEQKKHESDTRALMILDEIHVLGYMSSIETSTALLAGYGVRIWSIWQDLSQLKDLYDKRWETFIGNAGILQFFGLNDLTTLEYVSKRLGKTSVMKVSKNEISVKKAIEGYSGENLSIEQVPLLTPDEVAFFFSRQSSDQLIIYPGVNPILLTRTPYFEYMPELYNSYAIQLFYESTRSQLHTKGN